MDNSFADAGDAESQAPSTSTFPWLGTMRIPGQFVEFWSDMLVSRVAGTPPTSTWNVVVRCRLGPITVPEATPSARCRRS
jgi:hypothetical protein